MRTRVVLTAAQRRAVASGRFVRVEAGAETFVVGRVATGETGDRSAGELKAYVNMCRHRALPLDLGASSPMSDDGCFLLCHQHGALYRPSDGVCVTGPCAGEALEPRRIASTEDGAFLIDGPAAPAPPRFPYVAVEVAPEEAEEAGALLIELGAAGVEERDATTLVRGAADRVVLLGGFGSDDEARAAVAALPDAWAPRVDVVVGDAWRDEWKKHFEPFVLAPGIVVRPPWAERPPEAGEAVLVLEPGRAFGTGLHETTSLVASVLVEHAERVRGRPILDVGCGSGILSLVALVLGASEAVAIDVDADAVAVTEENALRNGLSSRLRASTAALASVAERFPVVVANIESRALVEMAEALIRCVEPGGILVLSGILSPEAAADQRTQLEAVCRAYGALRAPGGDARVRHVQHFMDTLELRKKGEWVALVLGAPTSLAAGTHPR